MIYERVISFSLQPFPGDDNNNQTNLTVQIGVAGESTTSNLCFVFLHGIGSSKETWHHQIQQLSPYHLCIAPDIRGHGLSSTCESLEFHLLVNDLEKILLDQSVQEIISTRLLIFICHSVGGAIGTSLYLQNNSLRPSIVAIIVIDLVEETGLDSLPHMKAALNTWPSYFHEIQQCIEFSIHHHRPHNTYSALISVPPLLTHDESEGIYTWKTPLLKYESDWTSWFTGFNDNFLSLSCYHCLIVATIDRLDKKMSMAHMQGRFELYVTHGTDGGHFIQEDNPGELLGIVVKFLLSKGILPSCQASNLLTVGLTSVAVGNVGSVGNRSSCTGAPHFRSEYIERSRLPFPVAHPGSRLERNRKIDDKS